MQLQAQVPTSTTSGPGNAVALNTSPMPTLTDVEIRILNRTGFDLVNIKAFGDKAHGQGFGNLKMNEASKYHVENGAYRCTYVEALAGKKKLFCQPIDYVGEEPLKAGRYTYVLTVVSSNWLDIECTTDPW